MKEFSRDIIDELQVQLPEDITFGEKELDVLRAIEEWRDFIIRPVHKELGCLWNTMEHFDTLCEAGFGKTEWNLQERNIVDVENFFSTLVYVLDNKKWSELKAQTKEKELKELYQVLGLRISDENLDMHKFETYRWKQGKEEAYTLIYQLYYAIKSGAITIDSFGRLSYKKMKECLFITYIDMVITRNEALQEKIKQQKQKVEWKSNYCKQVLENVFWKDHYVMVNWKEEDEEDSKITTSELPGNLNTMVLAGNAGVGKTTALRYLQYESCKRYNDGELEEKIPVLVTLREISEKQSLEQLICKTINIKQDGTLIEILEEGEIKLYLDGFNEIPEACADGAKEYINSIINNYNVNVVVTNRRSDTGIGPNKEGDNRKKTSKTYSIRNLEPAIVSKFFETKIKGESEEIYNNVINELENGGLKWVCEIPIKVTANQLDAIVQLALVGEKYGDKNILMRKYLKSYLLDRELQQKVGQKVLDEIKKGLSRLAGAMRNPEEGISAMNAVALFDNNTDYYAKALELLIIQLERGTVHFVENEYRDFFLDKVDPITGHYY